MLGSGRHHCSAGVGWKGQPVSRTGRHHCSASVGWKGQPVSGTDWHHCSAGVGQSKQCWALNMNVLQWWELQIVPCWSGAKQTM